MKNNNLPEIGRNEVALALEIYADYARIGNGETCVADTKDLKLAAKYLRDEPCVMDYSEIMHTICKRAVFLERRGSRKEIVLLETQTVQGYIFVGLSGGRYELPEKDYNKTYRVWSAWPSPQRSEGVPWED